MLKSPAALFPFPPKMELTSQATSNVAFGMGYGLWQLASHRLVLAAVSTERFVILLAMTDECEF
jgi:hypothetical protein